MDTSRPYADVVPGPRGRLLATLVQLETPMTVRSLARHADVSSQHALKIVNELSEAGLVFIERAGSAHMVSLNRQHLAAEPLIELVTSRRRLVDRLKRELSTWRFLAGAWLFGSTARGEGGPDSDVDILLVAKETVDDQDWLEATGQLQESIRIWTGNDVQLVEHDQQSFSRLVENGNVLLEAIRAEGLPLTASTPALLRRGPR